MVDDELLAGVGFDWALVFTSRDWKVPYLDLHTCAPPLFHSYLWMLTNIVLYGVPGPVGVRPPTGNRMAEGC